MMTKRYIPAARTYTQKEYDAVLKELPVAAGMVKLVCGISNSLAFLVMENARDKMKASGIYRMKVKQEFERVFRMRQEYDRRLLYPQGVRFFHVDDMDEELRRKYKKDLTDQEYYEFWTSICGPLYDKVWPICTCLAHKYWRTLHDRNMPNADAYQWALTAMAVNELAVVIFDKLLESHEQELRIPLDVAKETFEPFNFRHIAEAWERAMRLLDTGTEYYLTPEEDRNIELTLLQLRSTVTDQELILRSVLGTIKSFDSDVFATSGMAKKCQQEILETIYEKKDEGKKH